MRAQSYLTKRKNDDNLIMLSGGWAAPEAAGEAAASSLLSKAGRNSGEEPARNDGRPPGSQNKPDALPAQGNQQSFSKHSHSVI